MVVALIFAIASIVGIIQNRANKMAWGLLATSIVFILGDVAPGLW